MWTLLDGNANRGQCAAGEGIVIIASLPVWHGNNQTFEVRQKGEDLLKRG